MELRRKERFPTTVDGWSLHLTRFEAPEFEPSKPPVVLVPGYGMNHFVLQFHPRGTSMVESLARAGHEVWTANLRGQGRSKKLRRRAGKVTLANLVQNDLEAVIEDVISATRTNHQRVVLVGASLGGTISYAHLALRPGARVLGLIAFGAPLRWDHVPGIVRLAFASPRLLSLVRVRGTRRMARLFMPVVKRVPRIAHLYANPSHIDMTRADEMTQTVEDPHPGLNVELARWVKRKDLVIHGVNVSDALRKEDRPLLVVYANRDGVVPPDTATSARGIWGGPVEVVKVGTADDWYAHADLFVGDDCAKLAFEPMTKWLTRFARS